MILVGLYTLGFVWVWYQSYSDAILLPFYRRGNWVMILIYIVMVMLFSKAFGGLKAGYLKRTDMFYSQTLSILCVNVLTYFQISVVNRDFSATLPMVILTGYDLLVLVLWVVLVNRLYFRIYPPRHLVVIYGDKNAAELVLKMSRRVDKYMICESVSIAESTEEICAAIGRYEGVILCEIPGQRRKRLAQVLLRPKHPHLYRPEDLRHHPARSGGDPAVRYAAAAVPELRSVDGTAVGQACVRLDICCGIYRTALSGHAGLCPCHQAERRRAGAVQAEASDAGGKEFYVYKFRSMVVDAEKHGPQLAREDDDRITRVGRVLRRCRLDELPQLFNIFRGRCPWSGRVRASGAGAAI